MISRIVKSNKLHYRLIGGLVVLALASIFASVSSQAGEKASDNHDNFQINFASKLPVSGDLNIQDEPLFGAEFKYFFKHSGRHRLFVAGGYITDLENAGGSVDLFNIDFGSQFDLPRFWGKRNYLEYAAGITYRNEEFAFDLLDRTVTNSFSETDFKASFGYGIDFTQDIGTKLSIDQYGNSTAIGLNLYYQF